MVRVASVQSSVVFGNPKANTDFAIEHLRSLAAEKVQLAVFPECYLTGYCANSDDEARGIAIECSPDSSYFARLQAAVDELEIMAVIGFAEESEGRLYNSAALLQPGLPLQVYRKLHLPFIGFDRFATPGDELPLYNTAVGRIAILICYDQRPPEAARALALEGADILCLPTNWPIGAEVSADHVCIARAAENRMHVITANRIGSERGTDFIGRSKIIDASGAVLASASDGSITLIADLDLERARDKHVVIKPGEYEYDVLGTRRPDLYTKVQVSGHNDRTACATTKPI